MIKSFSVTDKLDVFKKKILSVLNYLKTSKYINLYTIIIFLFSLFMFSPMFFNYFLGDDTTFHAANISARGLNFSNIFSKILPDIANNLGYGTGIFYPMLPHTLGGLFLNIMSFLGLGEFAVLKLLKFIVIFGSGLTMYLYASKLFKSKKHGLITSLFYITSSYFFSDIYARDALNESFIFIFMPLIFLGIYYLFSENEKFKFYLCFITGYVGMMYSHLVLSVWFTLIFIIFLLLFIKEIFKKQHLVPLIIASILILIFTSLFTVPLIEHTLNGEYRVFNNVLSVLTWTFDLKNFFVQIPTISQQHNHLIVNFNIMVILLSLLALFKVFTKEIPLYRRKYILGFLLILIISMFFVCNKAIWYIVPDFLNNLQFPWRMCSFITFGISLFATEGFDVFCNFFKEKFIPVASLLIITILASNVYYNIQNIQLIGSLPYDVNDGMGWGNEYLPIEIKNQNDIAYLEKRKDDKIKIEKGKAKVKIISNNVPRMEFSVNDIKESVTLELPRLYYLGYKIVDEDGKEINYFKNDKGLISIKLNKDGKYYVSYPGTTSYQIAKVVCIFTATICIIIIFLKFKNKK